MKRTYYQTIALIIVIVGLFAARAPIGWAAEPVAVRAVLFYGNNCGHCHYVIEEVLPPLFEKHGDQLQIIGIEISNTTGQALYQSAISALGIPENQRGVPTLVVGDTFLVGSMAIPDLLPGIIEAGLAQGGINWPTFPGMTEVLAANGLTAESNEAETGAAAAVNTDSETESDVLAAYQNAADLDSFTVRDRLMLDPVGNSLAIIVLVGLVGVLAYAVVRLLRAGSFGPIQLDGRARWALPLLFLIGLGIAGYMAYVETTLTEAICGPVGDCNTVQQSAYATLFGFLPVGVLGLLGYVAMAVAWAFALWGNGSLQQLAGKALLAMSLFGVVFSIYLTFLEPFVIGATCLWCISSALIMAAILLILVSQIPAKKQPVLSRARA